MFIPRNTSTTAIQLCQRPQSNFSSQAFEIVYGINVVFHIVTHTKTIIESYHQLPIVIEFELFDSRYHNGVIFPIFCVFHISTNSS